MQRMDLARPIAAAAVGVWAAGAAHAGSLDRLKAVSDHAKQRVAGGPEHLWVGVAIFAALAVVVGCAAWWALGRKKG
ncbi:MAG TPA: hypothetical protein VK997_01195 [Deferrisomatales bacterium]|nr:hypothetical protein [Deferrisomatales bacterium]